MTEKLTCICGAWYTGERCICTANVQAPSYRNASMSLPTIEPEQVVIDTCDQGHKFAKLADHPLRNGIARCPHCMAAGLDTAHSVGGDDGR